MKRGLRCHRCDSYVGKEDLREWLVNGTEPVLHCSNLACNVTWRRGSLAEKLAQVFNELNSLKTGEQRKKEGLDIVESNTKKWILRVRAEAGRLARANGTVSADDLRRWSDDRNDHPHHPNAWGAVFRGKEWSPVGHKKSTYTTNNAREIKVWSLTATLKRGVDGACSRD